MSLRIIHLEQYYTLLMLFIICAFFEKLGMSKKVKKDEDYDNQGDMNDDFEPIDIVDATATINLDARRRLEKLMEDKELARLINSKYDDLF